MRTSKYSSSSNGFSQRAQAVEPPPIAWLMEQKLKYPALISLAAGFTDPDTLPDKETMQIMHQMAKSKAVMRTTLQYGTGSGRKRLRELTGQRIAELDHTASDKPAYDSERILITHGSQQFLYLVTEALCDAGDMVMVEAPTYFVYLSILKYFGVRAFSVPLKTDGIDLVAFEKKLEQLKQSGDLWRLKIIYLVTYHQNPTSQSMPLGKKQALMRLLARYERDAGHPIYVMEDAAYRELGFVQEASAPSMLSLPGALKRVIYSGTYSKPFATGIRVGFGISPAPLARALEHIKGNQDFGTSELLQAILERALESRLYAKHLKLIQARYAQKAGRMVDAMKKYFPSTVQWAAPQGGLYVWTKVPEPVDTGPRGELFEASLKQQVLYVPGCYAYAPDVMGPERNTAMRLSFGNASLHLIEEGIRRLGKSLRATLG